MASRTNDIFRFFARPNQSFNAGTSNAGGYVPGRGLSTTEIYRQRENTPMAYNPATGERTAPGTKLFHSGWNTSGVGPGTKGYTGSWRPGGYNFGMGTGRPSARTSGEFYAQRDEMEGNPLDNLELGNSNMMQSFLKNAMAEARGVSGGQTQSEGGWAGRTTYGPNASMAPGTAVFADEQEPDQAQLSQLIQEARAQESLDARGRAEEQMAAMQPSTGTGSATPGAMIEGIPADLYFQYKANESGDTNRFASPFANPTDDKGNPQAWQFSHRLAPFLKRLGVGQPFAPRRPL